MKSLSAETLLGQDKGLHENYDRIPESDLLEDYLKAVPELFVLSNAMQIVSSTNPKKWNP